jgi:hypothetical protein
MQAVKSLGSSREELPGVEGAERSEVTAGTGEAVPGPVTAKAHRSVAFYNRWRAGK